MHRILLSLIACLGLSACGSVVMSNVAVLGFTDPLGTDPAGYAIAVTIPDGVDVSKNGVVFKFANKNTILNIDEDYEYALERRETTDGQTIFRFAPADLPAIRTFQATVKDREMADPDANSGSISMFVAFCKIGDGPADDATFSVSIRTKPDGRFMPLIREASIKDALAEIDQGDDIRDQAPTCPQ